MSFQQQLNKVAFMMLYSNLGGHWDVFFSPEIVVQIWLDPLRSFWGHWTTFTKNFLQKIHSFMLFWPSYEGFWPLTASITSEVKNNYNHVTMERILNKIREFFFSRMYGLAVMQTISNSTTIRNMDNIHNIAWTLQYWPIFADSRVW